MARDYCKVCRGKGTVADPEYFGQLMGYCDQKGNTTPQMRCPNCTGTGFTGIPDSDNDFLGGIGITKLGGGGA